jgi:hypothetical protein
MQSFVGAGNENDMFMPFPYPFDGTEITFYQKYSSISPGAIARKCHFFDTCYKNVELF